MRGSSPVSIQLWSSPARQHPSALKKKEVLAHVVSRVSPREAELQQKLS